MKGSILALTSLCLVLAAGADIRAYNRKPRPKVNGKSGSSYSGSDSSDNVPSRGRYDSSSSSEDSGSGYHTKGYRYLGCFVAIHPIYARKTTRNRRMTVALCAKFCRRYTFFGLQSSNKCFCSKSRDVKRLYLKRPNFQCNMVCPGNFAERCGGLWRNSIYRYMTGGKNKAAVCSEKADIVFLLDTSSTVTNAEFQKMRTSVKKMIKSFNIRKNKIRVGLLTFSSETKIWFNLKTYTGKQSILRVINKVSLSGGMSRTDKALHVMVKQMFQLRAGGRAVVPNIAILITSGKSAYPSKTAIEAALAFRNGVTIFAVGIGNDLSFAELATITRNRQHTLHIKQRAHLDKNIAEFQELICDAIPDLSVGPPCTCTASGDPHYRTFDGQMIHFYGACKYTLVTHQGDKCEFSVEGKNEYRGRNRKVTYMRLVDFKYKGKVYRLHKGCSFYVNGIKKYVPYYDQDVEVYRTGNKLRLDGPCGVSIEFDGSHAFKVTVPKKIGKDLKGICGTCNGATDDLRTKLGVDVSKKPNKYTLIGNSYEVPDDSDLWIPHQHELKTTLQNRTPITNGCRYLTCKIYQHQKQPYVEYLEDKNFLRCTPAVDVHLCSPEMREKGDQSLCRLLKPQNKNKSIFKACIEADQDRALEMYDSCIIDFCAYHDDRQLNMIICEGLEGYAEQCSILGISVKWRSKTVCPLSCQKNALYNPGMSACPATCIEHSEPFHCPLPDVEGCQCKMGYILSNLDCVPKSECGCRTKQGEYIPVATEIQSPDCTSVIKCQKSLKSKKAELVTLKRPACGKNAVCIPLDGNYRCACKPGMSRDLLKECTNPVCRCTASGDPHYRTFDGQMIHFYGACKYTVAAVDKGNCNFAVEGKHEFRRNNHKVTFMRLVDFKYKGKVYRLHQGRKLYVNGMQKFPPYKDKAVKVYITGNKLRLEGPCNMVLEFDGVHYMELQIPKDIGNAVHGICGNCNGKADDLKTKDGKDVSSEKNKYSLIGNSYEVTDDSDLVLKKCKQAVDVDVCSQEQLKKAASSLCRLLKPDNKLSKFKDCIKADQVRALEMYDSCVTDFCAFMDQPNIVCEVLQSYADQCQYIGIPVNWRDENICPLPCAKNSIYKPMISACPATCTDRQAPYKCKHTPREGCECQPGYFLSNLECVKQEKCGCQIDDDEYLPIGKEIESPDCTHIITCQNVNGKSKIIKKERQPCGHNAECKPKDGHYTCECKKGTIGNPHRICSEPSCSCTGSGDPHFKTFDGQMIHFYGACKYTLVTYTGDKCEFSVEGKHEYRGRNRKVTYMRLVDVRYEGYLYRLHQGRKFYLNNIQKYVPYNIKGVNVYTVGRKLRLDLTICGVSVEFDGVHVFKVTVPKQMGKHLQGICGNCNGKRDDLRTKDGKDVSTLPNKYSLIGNSYEIPDDSDLWIPQCTPAIDAHLCTSELQKRADTSLCRLLKPENKDKSIFKQCIEADPGRALEMYDSCIIDFCAYHDDPELNVIVCEGLEGYAEQCEIMGISVQWRSKDVCPLPCPMNAVYNPKMSACQSTCVDPKAQLKCKLQEVEGCQCNDGYILSNVACVPKAECGCQTKEGEYIPVDTEIQSPDCTSVIKCQKSLKSKKAELVTLKRPACGKNAVCIPLDGNYRCACKPGMSGDPLKECTNPVCRCTASGDPHYRTFDGQMIHFYGACKYTVAAVDKGNCNFAVEGKHEFRRNNHKVTFMRLVDFKYKGKVYRLHQGRKLYVNGMQKFPPYKDKAVKVYITGNKLRLEGPCNMVLEFDGVHYMELQIPKDIGNAVHGICGNCNGKADDLKTKDGKDVSSEKNKYSLIGNSYEVTDDSDLVLKKCKQAVDVDVCSQEQLKKAASSLCRLLKPDNKLSKFKDCIKADPVRALEMYDSCVTDFCAFMDQPNIVCEVLQSYADQCQYIGIPVNWRDENSCPLPCAKNSIYKPMISACPATCTDRQAPYKCKHKPREGCECQPGYFLSNLECVKQEKCGCQIDDGEYLPIGKEIESPDCTHIITCQNVNGKSKIIKKERQPCGHNAECKPKDGHYTCECKKGTIGNPHRICSEPTCSCTGSGDPHYKTFDGQMIHFYGACKYTLVTYTGDKCEFSVEGKHEYRGGNRKVTYMRLVDVRYEGYLYRLHQGRKFYLKNIQKYVPYNIKGVNVYTVGRKLRLDLTICGVSVEFDGVHVFKVTVPKQMGKHLQGICGNCNGKRDDLRTKDGKDVSTSPNKYSLIGNSYEIPDDSDLWIPQCTPAIDAHLCTSELQKRADTSLCRLLKPENKDKNIFKQCIEADPGRALEMYDSCIIDFCAYHDDPELNAIVCEGLEGYAEQCEIMEISVQWRSKDVCPLPCPVNTVYNPKMSACQSTCVDPKAPLKCKLPEVEGCQCNDGYILSNVACVPKAECGCQTKEGEYIPVGTQIESSDCVSVSKCHRDKDGSAKLVTHKRPECGKNAVCKPVDGHYKCSCRTGMEGNPFKECNNPLCTCTASGDPHYRTFDGQMIHFYGACKYTVASIFNGNCNFVIEGKHEYRGNNRKVTFMRLVDFKYNGKVYRLHQKRKFYVDGIQKFPPYKDKVVKVYITGNKLRLEGPCKMVLEFDGVHYMELKIPKEIGNDMRGLCGNCNGKADDLKTIGGKDVSSEKNKYSLIGNSYQVTDDSDLVLKQCRQAVDIELCSQEHLQKAEASLCRFIKPANKLKSRFKNCIEADPVRASEMYHSCITDFCAFMDNPNIVCEVLQGYADQCRFIGIPVNWRDENICPLPCPTHSIYKPRISACPSTCTDTNAPFTCKLTPREGCECKPGYVLSNLECVRLEKCGCQTADGEYIPIGEAIESSDCTHVIKCLYDNGKSRIVKHKRLACGHNAECKPIDGHYKCVCKKGTTGNPNKICNEPTCSCTGSGDPHYKTFDGQMIHFYGACKYTLVTYKGGKCDFSVEGKHEYRGSNRKVTYLRLVDVRYEGQLYRLHQGRKFYVSGIQKYVPYISRGIIVYTAGRKLRLDLTLCGVSVQFDGVHIFKVTVPKQIGDHLKGICGNCNGQTDDLRTKDGKDVSSSHNKYSLIGNSYEIPDDSDLFIPQCTPSTDVSLCTPDLRKKADVSQCRLLKPDNKDKSTFNQCIEADPGRALEMYDSCIIDFCAYHDDPELNVIVCEGLEGYAEQCAILGISVQWRSKTLCPLPCPMNAVYNPKMSACQPTCVDPKAPLKCKLQDVEGCQCKEGYILSNLACVQMTECGCQTKEGAYLPVGTEIESPDCNRVSKCQNGTHGKAELVTLKRQSCGTNAVCKPVDGHYRCTCNPGMEGNPFKECTNPYCTCTASGDPHYRTFDGQIIHFYGACKYTVAAVQNEKCNFAIEGKHEYRGNNRKVTFMRLVDFKYNGKVYRLTKGRQFHVDRIRKFTPYNENSIKVYTTGNKLRLEGPCGVIIEFDGNHYMELTVPKDIGNDVHGICGNCNGKADDLKTKEGMDVSADRNKYSLIGNSYEVLDDSDLILKQCKPTTDASLCTPEQRKRAELSLCRLLKPENMGSSKFKICIEADRTRAQEMYDSCIIDFCAFENQPNIVCEALQGYADQCQYIGISVNWRDSKICPLHCPQFSKYKPLMTSCPATCSEIEAPYTCQLAPREGCECQQGYVLSDLECVPVDKCGCKTDFGEYIPVGKKVESPDCTSVSKCVILYGKPNIVKTKRQACGENAVCMPREGHYTCVCKTGTTGDPYTKCTVPECGKAADIVFVLDASSSVKKPNFNKMLAFVKTMVAGFDIGKEKIRIGVMTYSNRPKVWFDLNKYSTKLTINDAIDTIPYFKGTTYTDKALAKMCEEMFKTENGDRFDVPNIGIIITDGKSTFPDKTKIEADKVHELNIQMFGIGIGKGIDKKELEYIASSKGNVMNIANFDGLEMISAKFQQLTCQGISTSSTGLVDKVTDSL